MGSNYGISDFIRETIEEIRELSTLNQIVIGGTAGVASGVVLSRFGKLAAVSIGGGAVLLQMAQHFGFIEIKFGKPSRFDRIKKRMIKAAEEVGLPVRNESNAEKFFKELGFFLQDNISFGASYCGGVLVGIAF